MSEKRFVQLGDTSIKDTLTGEEWYAPCETSLLKLLNEQQELIEELRLQEKEKGVPVFVVREGKNPIALFFNEQRASWYCQENMADLSYQQEKWCRVE